MLLILIALLGLGLSACGGGEGGDENDGAAVTDDAEQSETTVEEVSANIPSGWTAAEFNDPFTFAVPGDWNGDPDAGVWWPGEGSLAMGRPAISLHTGGIPMLQGASFEDRIANHTNNTLENRKDYTVGGMQAVSGSWTLGGKKYVGVLIKEEISADVAIAHFLNCRAPAADFPAYEQVFNDIIATFKP
jgi:hypothetical protein